MGRPQGAGEDREVGSGLRVPSTGRPRVAPVPAEHAAGSGHHDSGSCPRTGPGGRAWGRRAWFPPRACGRPLGRSEGDLKTKGRRGEGRASRAFRGTAPGVPQAGRSWPAWRPGAGDGRAHSGGFRCPHTRALAALWPRTAPRPAGRRSGARRAVPCCALRCATDDRAPGHRLPARVALLVGRARRGRSITVSSRLRSNTSR